MGQRRRMAGSSRRDSTRAEPKQRRYGRVDRKKLIEVALPLDAINARSAREKSIRHGHPSTLHLWWARRPLAACRAVLFAQLVDDPSAHPDQFPDEESQDDGARAAVRHHPRPREVGELQQRGRARGGPRRDPSRSCDGNPPPILDPFAGGGSIPLEAQRLGLEAHASDLNPVAVLINKALIEIPPKLGRPAARAPRRPSNRTRWTRRRRAWPRTSAATASGCATRPSAASATSTRRRRCPTARRPP